jgi:tetratricopeptide (TPR) repeat protein
MDYVFRGRSSFLKPNSRERWDETIGLFERALALDPGLVNAQSLLASALADRVLAGFSYSAATDLARAEGLVAQALAQAPRSSLPHFAKGQLMRARGLPEEAIPEYETAIALDRNSVGAMFGLGQCKLLTGSIDEDIRLVEQAIRLSPRGIANGILYLEIGRANLLQSRIDEAIQSLKTARAINPEHPSTPGFLASTYALKGEAERAVTELAEARRLSTDYRFSSIARLRTAAYWGVPKIRALYEATYFAGLRKAGMPEE